MSLNFDGMIVLRPSRRKMALLLAGCIAFVVIGLAMVGTGAAMGWLVLIFFGFGAIATVVVSLPGAAYLRLEPNGFTQCTLFRPAFVPWTSVRGFGVTSIFNNKMVGVKFEANAESRLMRVTSGLVGWDGSLPDTYGMTAEALAELMNQALSKARPRNC
jgi:hypothetical protein